MIKDSDVTFSIEIMHELGKNIKIKVLAEYKHFSFEEETETISDNEFELLEIISKLKKNLLNKINKQINTN